MYLGIEIGGTKLQLGVGRAEASPLVAVERFDVDPSRGAIGILERIETAGIALVQKHQCTSIGIGFGGPVDTSCGRVVKSHQIEGWGDFPLAQWCQRNLGLPTHVQNDCDSAALAEALYGAGQGHRVVFYVTVGTGMGGGLVIDRQIYRGSGAGAAEIGHLRPGLLADRPDYTVESLASGPGIAASARSRLTDSIAHPFDSFFSRFYRKRDLRTRDDQPQLTKEQAEAEFGTDLLSRCDGELENLTAKTVARAASDGNEIAREVLEHSVEALGWAIAQVITLVAPSVVILGGGVSLIEQSLFLVPLREQVQRYVFPPFAGKYAIVPAGLGELAVVYGAIAVAHASAT
jgi:glucokinase